MRSKIIIPFLLFLFTTTTFAFEPEPRARGSVVLNVKNYGARGNGTADDTNAIKRAIAALPYAGGTVYIPSGTYLIDTTKNLALRSRMHLQLASDATLKAIPNGLQRFYIINIYKVSDVEVSGGTIQGERYEHKGTLGEWGNGIYVSGSKRVTIRNLITRDNWGDGISIVGTKVEPYIFSEDIIVDNVLATNNRRQGLSIGRSSNVRVYDSEFSYTNGAPPSYGIDVEPEPTEGAYTSDVRIEGNSFHHNAGGGIQLYKLVSEVVVIRNDISYNPFGMYIIRTVNGVIWGNKFRHNTFLAIAVRNYTTSFDIWGNVFRNNMTSKYGLTNDTNPLRTLTGLAVGTEDHIGVVPEAIDTYVGANYYAK